MRDVLTTPWSRLAVSNEKKGPKKATFTLEGYIGWDPEKWWNGEKQTNTKEAIRAELKALAELKADELDVWINSPGGNVNHGISIHDILEKFPGNITTYVEGMTASIATIIAQAGDERHISENALYLIHLPMTWGSGNVFDFRMTADDLEKIAGRLAAIYASHGGMTEELAMALMNENSGRGRWLDASEAREAGLVDVVYTPRAMAAAIGIDHFDVLGLPPLPDGYVAALSPREQTQLSDIQGDDMPGSAAPGDSNHEAENTEHMMEKAQIGNLKALFGADFALNAIESDMEYMDAMATGAEELAGRLATVNTEVTNLTAERDTLKARVAELEAKVKDPLEPSANREPPPETPAAPKPIPEAHAELVSGGMSDADAWAKLRSERPQDYAAHFSIHTGE